MVNQAKVLVVSNDVVPGQALPVAAPGLRAFGLAEGLRERGMETTLAVVRRIVERRWRDSVPPPGSPRTDVVAAGDLSTYISTHEPEVVIFTNSNAVDAFEWRPGTRYIYDFFAPKMLELAYKHGDEHPRDELDFLRDRKLRGLRHADAVIVNGRKKLGYVYAWLLQTDRDVREVPVEVVNMAVPVMEISERTVERPIRFSVTGYVQPWSRPGGWTHQLLPEIEAGRAHLDIVVAAHWGGRAPDQERSALHPELEPLLQHEGVMRHRPMTYSDFQRFLARTDVSVDLFEYNLEREFAMITRTVVSLSCGVPVIHPPFTEVSEFIREYEAGWLVDPGDQEAVHDVFEEICSDPAVVEQRRANARKLSRAVFSPRAAAKPLAEVINRW